MPDDVVLNKIAMIERCLLRIREEYLGHEMELAIIYPAGFDHPQSAARL